MLVNCLQNSTAPNMSHYKGEPIIYGADGVYDRNVFAQRQIASSDGSWEPLS